MTRPTETSSDVTMLTDGGFSEVCDECGRHIAVAGHDPDCPEQSDTNDADQEGSE